MQSGSWNVKLLITVGRPQEVIVAGRLVALAADVIVDESNVVSEPEGGVTVDESSIDDELEANAIGDDDMVVEVRDLFV